MPAKPPMVFHFKFSWVSAVIIMAVVCHNGCLSYQITKQTDGSEITPLSQTLKLNETTLAEVLYQYGAPRKIHLRNEHMVLIYQRTVSQDRKLSLSIPLYYTYRGYDISASGGLQRDDVLALFFSSDGILDNFVVEQESNHPFFETFFQD